MTKFLGQNLIKLLNFAVNGNFNDVITINDEVIPFCEDYVGKTFTTDPKKRMIVGISSGGNAAFTAAWHHPHLWGKVLSHVS